MYTGLDRGLRCYIKHAGCFHSALMVRIQLSSFALMCPIGAQQLLPKACMHDRKGQSLSTGLLVVETGHLILLSVFFAGRLPISEEEARTVPLQ